MKWPFNTPLKSMSLLEMEMMLPDLPDGFRWDVWQAGHKHVLDIKDCVGDAWVSVVGKNLPHMIDEALARASGENTMTGPYFRGETNNKDNPFRG